MEKKTIKKYANRKLYDTDTSKYITLKEILAMPKGSFEIVDNATKEVITNNTLMSALLVYANSDQVAKAVDILYT